jgi:hypothetical protein
MKWFLPAVSDEGELEETYTYMREYARKATNLVFSESRIDTVRYSVGDGAKTVSVGEWLHGAIVQCIFESREHYVLLTTNGEGLGQPILIDQGLVLKVEFFNGFDFHAAA